MRPDPASDLLLPRFLRVSVIGLLGSGLALAIGHIVAANVTGTSHIEVVVRVIGAAFRGFGTGFGLLFVLTSASGAVHATLRRITRR